MSTQTHDAMTPVARRCRARSSRTGLPCRQVAIKGGAVCVAHGGRAPQVKRKAAQRIADMLADAIDPNRVLREAGRLAYSDIRQLYDDTGRLLPIKQWPDDIARAVASIEQEEVRGNVDKGDGQFDRVLKTKVRLWDKPGKLENLMRMHGHLTEKRELTINVNVTERLAAGRKRVAALRGAQGVVDGASESVHNVIEAEARLLTDGEQTK